MIINAFLHQNKTLTKGGLYAVFSFFNRGIGFILLIIIANYLPVSEYGQLSLYHTITMFLGYFIAMSSEGFADISFFKNEGKNYKEDLTWIIVFASGMLVLLSVIVMIFGKWISSALSLDRSLLWFAIVTSYFSVFNKLNLGYRRVREKIVSYGVISCGYALSYFAITLLLIIVFKEGWKGRVYSESICLCLFSCVALFTFINHKQFNFSLHWERLKTIIIWGIPLIPHLATTWIRQGCDQYIINHNYSLTEVGIFSFALTMASVVEMIGSSFNATMSVNIFKVLSNNELSGESKIKNLKHQSKEIAIVYIVAYILVILGCMVLIPIAMPRYSNSLPYFYLLSVYGLLRCFYFLFCNYLFFYSKNKYLMYITFGSSILHLLLSLLLTKYSLFFTASIYVFSQLVIDIIVIVYAKRLINNNI